MKVGTGEAECKGCGYTYVPKQGDPEYPISPGVRFEQLPEEIVPIENGGGCGLC